MKKHLITGGTGFVGKHLVRSLVSRGDTVFLLVRQKNRSTPGNLKIIEGDITKENLGISQKRLQDLKKENIDFVWHLAANLSFSQKMDDQERFKTNVTGTKNVVQMTNYLKAVFCHCSTAYVCGDSREFSEDDWSVGQTFRNAYEQTKYLGEEVVRTKSIVPYLIFRPSIIIDQPTPGKASNCTFGYYRLIFMFYLFKHWLAKKRISLPFFIMPYPKNVRINMVQVDDVINAMITISLQSAAYNKTYHLTHPEPRSYIFLLKTVLEDLSISNVLYIGMDPRLFRFLFMMLFSTVFPLRKYFKSLQFYLPYMTTSPRFARANIDLFTYPPEVLSKKYFSGINKEAFENIFPGISTSPF